MKLKVRLKNHGKIDGVIHQGGEVVVIDASKFTDTWMEKLEVVKEKSSKSFINKLLSS